MIILVALVWPTKSIDHNGYYWPHWTNSVEKKLQCQGQYTVYISHSLTLLSHDEDVLFWGADWLMMIGLSLESANDNFFYKCKVQKGH